MNANCRQWSSGERVCCCPLLFSLNQLGGKWRNQSETTNERCQSKRNPARWGEGCAHGSQFSQCLHIPTEVAASWSKGKGKNRLNLFESRVNKGWNIFPSPVHVLMTVVLSLSRVLPQSQSQSAFQSPLICRHQGRLGRQGKRKPRLLLTTLRLRLKHPQRVVFTPQLNEIFWQLLSTAFRLLQTMNLSEKRYVKRGILEIKGLLFVMNSPTLPFFSRQFPVLEEKVKF